MRRLNHRVMRRREVLRRGDNSRLAKDIEKMLYNYVFDGFEEATGRRNAGKDVIDPFIYQIEAGLYDIDFLMDMFEKIVDEVDVIIRQETEKMNNYKQVIRTQARYVRDMLEDDYVN